MASLSDKLIEYQARAERLKWRDLARLWNAIITTGTPDWDAGKAFEYLVIRAFTLSGLEAVYPYDVPPGGKPLEQIDGLVYLGDCAFLIECKDREANDIEAIAKLRHQLHRRPDTTFGCVFVTGDFTSPALTLTDFSVPHRILLWANEDIERAIGNKDFASVLREKYRQLCMYGMTDHSPNYKGIEL